ncbi:S49 family peptidase, partial [bacterium]|nr:S49 family peptidase [bacterium]
RPMTSADRRLIQALLDEAHETFIADVSRGRDALDLEEVRALATGWVWSGKEGVVNGLADVLVEGWGEALAGLCAAAGLEPECATLDVVPESPWYESLLTGQRPDAASLLAEALAISARPMAIFRPAFP